MIKAIRKRARQFLHLRGVKQVLERIPRVRRIYAGWNRAHPFDVENGIDTSGFVPVEQIHPDRSLTKLIIVYAGSQPSIVRRALATLPDPQERAFVDLGCGKGRATIVASELPFREITGVELSSDLARIARSNIDRIRSRYPGRPPINVVEGNAVRHSFPKGKLVIFMYHPFGRELMSELIRAIETHLDDSGGHVFVVYVNPVHGNLFDASPAFGRWFAQVVPYDESEVGFGPDLEETVVIWQSLRGALPSPHPGAQRPILVLKEGWTVGLGQ